jgi:hypothetical protein
MVAVLIFIWSIVWGALSAQFLVQTVTSLIVAVIFFAGLAFSKVAKLLNAIAFATSAAQVVLFGVLFQGGNWLSSHVIDYGSWNATSVAGLLSFSATIVYCVLQVPGKLLLARMSAWRPYFAEASMAVPANERAAFARKCKADEPPDQSDDPSKIKRVFSLGHHFHRFVLREYRAFTTMFWPFAGREPQAAATEKSPGTREEKDTWPDSGPSQERRRPSPGGEMDDLKHQLDDLQQRIDAARQKADR